MKNKNTYTLNAIVNDFARNGVNIIQLLESLNAIVTESNDFVTFNITRDDGSIFSTKLPSIGKIQNDISALKNLLDDLYNVKNNEVFVISNGVKYPIFIPNYPYDLLPPFNLTDVTYVYRNDEYYTRIYLNNLNNKIKFVKYILDVTSDSFNEIQITDLKDLEKYLIENDIKYKVSDGLILTEPSQIRYKGKFSVLGNKKNIYRLDTLNYTNQNGDTFRLNVNDVLYYQNTEVLITSIDYNKRQVTLETQKGYDNINVGNILTLISPFNVTEYIDVQSNINERFYCFFKNINETFNVESNDYSNPIKVDVSQLKNNNVDITTFNINDATKNKLIPRTLGLKPNAPILNNTDFKVVRINDHLFQESTVTSVQEKISRKQELVSEITEIDKAIDDRKTLLSATLTVDSAKIKTYQNEVENLVNKRKIKTGEYSSIINELSTVNREELKFITPKFRIRGFFEIPNQMFSSLTGKQEIVQFIISYRYLGKKQNTSQNKNFIRTSQDGNKKIGVFSDWIEIKTTERIRVFNSEKNHWVWEEQKTEDGQQVNINQIDIPIQRNESVEIKIKSISEAGYPSEPWMSDWSNVAIIQFPEEIVDVNSISETIEQTIQDSAKIIVEDVMASKGVDVHIKNSITRNDQFFAHPAQEVSSGLYDSSGNLLTLEQVLKNMQGSIIDLQKIIQNEVPKLNILLIHPDGSEMIINRNVKNNVFAGYYKDDVSNLPSNSQNGVVIQKDFQLFLYHTSGNSLYLRSLAHGSGNLGDYELKSDRKYESTPIYIQNSTFHEDEGNYTTPPFKPQQRGQFIYMRYKDVGLLNDLYNNSEDAHTKYKITDPDYLQQREYCPESEPTRYGVRPVFKSNEFGMYVYLNVTNWSDIFVGASAYGSVKEIKSGKENGISIPISVVYKITNSSGQIVDNLTNITYTKKIGVDIFPFQQNEISFDLEFSVKYDKNIYTKS